MKSLMIAAMATALTLGGAGLAMAAGPDQTGGSPGNGAAKVSGMSNQGGAAGNGAATL